MSAATKRKLVVCGGSGFLGSRICKAASARGWEVTSISRSGEPSWSSVTSSAEAPVWSKQVTWAKADIFAPKTYTSHLDGADAVVHSMGILLETDYKKVLQGKESIVGAIGRMFGSSKAGTQNPLERRQGDVVEPQQGGGQMTYEAMNRDSAVILAQEASEHKVSTFLYVSAAEGAPVLPARYIKTKREAESTIASTFSNMRTMFLRPSFLYDSTRPFTIPIAAMGGAAAVVNSFVGGRLTPILGAGAIKPLGVEAVGEAVVEALEDNELRGAIDVPEIESLASRAWRKRMA